MSDLRCGSREERFLPQKGIFAWGLAWVILLLGLPSALCQTETSVGMTGKIEALVLPGTELEVKPIAGRTSPVVLQVVRVYPHGNSFRYDMEFTGLDPGKHDLRDYLRRKDGSPVGELPAIPVVVTPSLPKGQVLPHELEVGPGPALGGYRVIAGIAAVIWGAVLVGLIASFIKPRKGAAGLSQQVPQSIAEKLRPLVEGAIAGTLTRTELANLERGLFAWWRKRLALEEMEPALAMEKLRQNPESGPLLGQLEVWLHRPGSPEKVDVGVLLEPFRNLPVTGLDVTGGTG